MLRPKITLACLSVGLALTAAWAFDTTEYVFSHEPLGLSVESVVLRPRSPVSRKLLNAALCLEFDANWEVAAQRSIRVKNNRTVTLDATCITSDGKRYEAPSFYGSSTRERHQFCGNFNKIPLETLVTRCELRASEQITMRQAIWREHSPK